MESKIRHKIKLEEAKKRVRDIKSFYIHLTVYLFINTAIILVNNHSSFSSNGTIELSDFVTAFFWGIGLFAHWASVFGPTFFFGKNWEERKIQSYMEEEKENKHKWE